MVVWLAAHSDLEKDSYNLYHDEYSTLIRVGEMNREEVLKDLQFNPPDGIVEHLKKEFGIV